MLPSPPALAAAFNHSAGHDAEAEYDRLRDLARAEAQKRNECFERVRLPPAVPTTLLPPAYTSAGVPRHRHAN